MFTLEKPQFVNVTGRKIREVHGIPNPPEEKKDPQEHQRFFSKETLKEKIQKLMKHPFVRIVKFLLFLLAYIKIATLIWNAAAQLLLAIRKAGNAVYA